MKVGIVALELYDGGEISWTDTLIEALCMIDEIRVVNLYVHKNYDYWLSKYGKNNKVKLYSSPSDLRFRSDLMAKIMKMLIYLNLTPIDTIIKALHRINYLEENDIYIFPYISNHALFCQKPYVITPQDVRQRYKKMNIGFIENIKKNISLKYQKKSLGKASKIVVESHYVKKDVMEYYFINEDKIKIILCPPPKSKISIDKKLLSEIMKKYDLPTQYILYPAHLIEDKNHINLIRAVYILKKQYSEEVNLILVGSKKPFAQVIFKEIEKLNMQNQIKYLGYVPDEDMPCLYKLSTALVMPTLFESVSLPIWEAFYLGVPVVSSNVCALPEQVGDAGLLFNPNDPEDIAEKIYKIWTDENLRSSLVEKGYKRISNLTIENYSKQWKHLIEEVVSNIKK